MKTLQMNENVRKQSRGRAGRLSDVLPAGAALLMALGAGPNAFAQDSAPSNQSPGYTLEEIIVTAQRREERLQDVPIALTTLSSDQLSRSRIETTQEIALVTPGLMFASVGGYGQPRIRGIGTGADAPSLENPVATYVDGVYYAHQLSSVFSLNNIQQITVLKGPQGTLFGRNATGGLIQITTRKPTQEFTGSAKLGYGNYNTASANLYVSGGVTDNLAADIAVYFRDQGDGYGVNKATGQEINKMRSFASRSKWVLTASDRTEITLILDYGRDKGALVQAPAPGTTPLGGGVFTGQDVNIPSQFLNRGEYGGASLRIQYDFDDMELVSTSAFRRNTGKILFPNATSDPASLTLVTLNDKFKQYTQEFQLQSSGAQRVNWTVGTFLYAGDGGWQPLTISGGALFPLNSIGISNSQKTYSGAAYGQATAEVMKDTNLTLGLRYTYDKRKWRATQEFDAPFPIPSFADKAEQSFKKVTWRASLDHRLSPDALVYASVNRGFKSGGFNDSVLPAALYEPEVLDAYEVGLKTEVLDKRVRINTAAYYYNYKNIQVSRYAAGNIVIYNGAGAEVYGLDLDAQARVTPNLMLTGGLSLMKSKYTSFPNADITTPLPGGGTNIAVGDAKGNRLSYAPKWTANVALDYTVPLPVGDVTFNATYYHNNGWFSDPDNRLRQPSYNVVNTSLTLASHEDTWSLMVWGKNIFNKQYAVYLHAQANGDSTQLAAPRTYGVQLQYNF